MKKNEELNIQTGIVTLLRMYNILVFAVPNGTNIRNVITRKLLKNSGLLAGVSDLIIVLPRKIVFVEIKTEKGKQSPDQKEFQARVERLGFTYLIWRNVDEAINFLKINKD